MGKQDSPTTQAPAAPARRRMTQAERVQLSDARMFEAALSIINERGTHNTTLKETGERAGYSRGLASNRFGSKEELFHDLVVRIHRQSQQEMVEAVGDKTGLEALSAAVKAIAAFFGRDQGYIRAMYILYYETIGSSNRIRKRIALQHVGYRRVIEHWVDQAKADGSAKSDVNANTFAFEFLALYFGTVYLWLVSPETVDLSATFDRLMEAAIAQIKLAS